MKENMANKNDRCVIEPSYRNSTVNNIQKPLDKATKRKLYVAAIEEIKERIKEVDSIVPRMATIASVLKNAMPHFFWCGFYFAEEGELIIGPYQGTTACPSIAYSGVCGSAAKKKETVIVPNVHEVPGHIPCDERSNSEMVLPIIDKRGMVIGVLDIDSTHFDAFDDIDKKHLEEIIPLLLEKED